MNTREQRQSTDAYQSEGTKNQFRGPDLSPIAGPGRASAFVCREQIVPAEEFMDRFNELVLGPNVLPNKSTPWILPQQSRVSYWGEANHKQPHTESIKKRETNRGIS